MNCESQLYEYMHTAVPTPRSLESKNHRFKLSLATQPDLLSEQTKAGCGGDVSAPFIPALSEQFEAILVYITSSRPARAP